MRLSHESALLDGTRAIQRLRLFLKLCAPPRLRISFPRPRSVPSASDEMGALPFRAEHQSQLSSSTGRSHAVDRVAAGALV